MIRVSRFLLTLLLIGSAAQTVSAQLVVPSDRYYMNLLFDAERRPHFCEELDSARGTAHTYGVDRDAFGRVTTIRRYYFGNLASRELWTIMKFRYDTLANGYIAVGRSWHGPDGLPIPIRIAADDDAVAYGEEALYDTTGQLLMTTLLNNEGERVENVNAVTQTIYRRRPDGTRLQEWRYSNNKQYYGSDPDYWNMQFGELDRNAWFRTYTTDRNGFVLTEQPLGIDLKPVPFPTGEMRHEYIRNECGKPIAISYTDSDGKPMADSSGIARIEFSYDENGRLTEWASFNIDAKPQGIDAMWGAARGVRVYREFDGAIVSDKLFDAAGEEIVQ